MANKSVQHILLTNWIDWISEEEQMLQAKYAKLRKKKKQVAAFKNQGNAKPEENQPSKVSTLSSTTKKSLGSMDAKEQAKKLIRSGTINLQPSRQRETNEKSTGFKRYASFYIMLFLSFLECWILLIW